MVKLQRQVAYKYRGHNIYKFRLNVPSQVVEEADWSDGTELEFQVKGKVVEVLPKEPQ